MTLLDPNDDRLRDPAKPPLDTDVLRHYGDEMADITRPRVSAELLREAADTIDSLRASLRGGF